LKSKLIIFDFDGTLTKKDSFIQFIVYCFGYNYFLLSAPIILFYYFIFRIGLMKRHQAKERVFSWFFKGWAYKDFQAKCEDFKFVIPRFLKPEAIDTMNKYADYERIIISASVENWILPWAIKHNFNAVLGTQIMVGEDEVLTGKFSSKNCYGKEKLNRLMTYQACLDEKYIVVYGDSKGDSELIAVANEFYYKTLLNKKSRSLA